MFAYSRSRLSSGTRRTSGASLSLSSTRSTLSSCSGLTITTLWEEETGFSKYQHIFDVPFLVIVLNIHINLHILFEIISGGLTGGPANPGAPAGPTSPRSPCRQQAVLQNSCANQFKKALHFDILLLISSSTAAYRGSTGSRRASRSKASTLTLNKKYISKSLIYFICGIIHLHTLTRECKYIFPSELK